MALSMFGAKQIMFGTDIPLREDIELQLRDIEALGLTATELDDIYAGNAARLLGISLSSGL
jgi:predicted TIM-barrel fold metal-dependent hydrolase